MKEPPPTIKLAWIAKLAIAATFFNSWVIFEETVIDRHGLWRYMPFYRVGLFCTWDVVALLAIVPLVLLGIDRIRHVVFASVRRFCPIQHCRLC